MLTRRFNWRRARLEQTAGVTALYLTTVIFTGTMFDVIVFLYQTITHDNDNEENPQVLEYLHALAVHHLQHYPSHRIPRTPQHFHNKVNNFFFIPTWVKPL